jgi:hypothetical protein
MVVRWTYSYRVTEFDPNKPEFTFIGVDTKHDSHYQVATLINALNDGQAKHIKEETPGL